MSWLQPEKDSSILAQENVAAFINEYGKTAEVVLDCFTRIDPLHVFMGENIDEYIGYAKKFVKQLGALKLADLTLKQISDFVTNSFDKEQVGIFVSEEDINLLSYLIFLEVKVKGETDK